MAALGLTILIALPWQIYTFIRFPNEALYELMYNSRHFTEVIEGHRGSFWLHFNSFYKLYGYYTGFLILPALILLYFNVKDRKLYLSMVFMVLLTYLFFSISATKMLSFTLIVCMINFIILASFFDLLLKLTGKAQLTSLTGKLVFVIIVIGLVAYRFDIKLIQSEHTSWEKGNTPYNMLSHNRELFKSLDLPSGTVIFNVKGQHYIECMFYTGLPSYHTIPDLDQFKDLKNKGLTIAIFRPLKSVLPDFLLNDPDVIILDEVVKGYD